MNLFVRTPARRRALALAVLALGGTAGAGCLGEPPIEERITRLEILDANPVDAAAFAIGGATSVTMRARITYREILTGSVVGELRASEAMTTDDTSFDLDTHWEEKSADVDLVLENSVSLGFATVGVTGWDHLIHELDLTFEAGAPQRDASGVAPVVGAPTGLFLVLYFSTDIEEVELDNGEEFEVVTPLFSRDHPILYEGVEIVAGGTS